jgi:hypothetical protein
MKRIILVLAATAFAHAAGAASVYHGLGEGNPDLYSGLPIEAGSMGVTASPPAIGSAFNRYHGIDRANPDLFGPTATAPARGQDRPFDEYHGIADGNPDIR